MADVQYDGNIVHLDIDDYAEDKDADRKIVKNEESKRLGQQPQSRNLVLAALRRRIHQSW